MHVIWPWLAMYPWAHNSILFSSASGTSSESSPVHPDEGSGAGPSAPPPPQGFSPQGSHRKFGKLSKFFGRGFGRILPFFVSAIFFLSGFFAFLSPLPLMLVSIRNGKKMGILVAVFNLIVVALLGGTVSGFAYFIFAVILAFSLVWSLMKLKTIEKAGAFTLAVMTLMALVCLGGYSLYYHVKPLSEVKLMVNQFVDLLNQTMTKDMGSGISDLAEFEDWKRNLLIELPSAIAVVAIVFVWSNLVVLLRINPNGIREKIGLDSRFFQKWKAPEFLVWPSIVAGLFLLVEIPIVSDVSRNLFKILMAIYAIQGLSILSFLFDSWGIRGFFRALGFLLVVTTMMPLLLSIGFFDLWFDFRTKFRQT